MKCASKGCDNERIKGRTLCESCKKAREVAPKVRCCVGDCKHNAVNEGIKCRFCLSREKAMAEARAPNTTGFKTCCKCKESKPVWEFSVNRDSPDGLDATDKGCRNQAKGTRRPSTNQSLHEEYVHFGGRECAKLLRRPLGVTL